ncbi:muropeptide transporter [Pusillimonas minor]|uniref:muropeptide transporter n=1 Tax=Pusillimonas minor TaxID=2697024 RepID=UPI003D279E2D
MLREAVISPFSSVYASPRVYPLLVLGFASGLPLALVTGTLQAWATVSGVSLQNIGFLTLVGTAYTLKFLWAPLVDRYAPNFLGRRRSWMFFSQVLLGIFIMAMGMLSPSSHLGLLAAVAVIVAFLSATQDIAFDAYSTDVLRDNERAAGAALKVLGYRLAMIVSGGLALVLAGSWLGWQYTYALMGVFMMLCALATVLAPEPEVIAAAPRTLGVAVVAPLSEFFSRRGAVLILLLIVLYKLGDAFAGALSTTFLIRGAGFSTEEVGAVNKIFGLVATIVGALAGGSIMARMGLYRSLLLFGILQAVSNFGYWVLAVTPPHLYTMGMVVAIENVCGGLGTAAFVALLMALCNQQFSATQFALLSALSAVGRTYLAGPFTPPLVETFGWPQFFVFTVLIALPGLALLWFKRDDIRLLDSTDRH